MRVFVYTAVLLVFWSIGKPLMVQAAESVTLAQSGYSKDFDSGKSVPVWSIVIGNVKKGEFSAHARYGLDGTVWVHYQQGWRSTNFRRPEVAVNETGDISQVVRDIKVGGSEILPKNFSGLTTDELAFIEYIVNYELGGTKAFLVPGTSATEAEKVFHRLEEINKAVQ